MNLEDALRAVIEAARSWGSQRLQLDEGTKLYDLREAVEALEALLPDARIEAVEAPRLWREVFEGKPVTGVGRLTANGDAPQLSGPPE